ncbi:MAG: hypothetical protein KF784_12995 [Fimbriimonadaceae bacterium]|nr:hypothetical protein [Fimbriimonadaceae bacterium]
MRVNIWKQLLTAMTLTLAVCLAHADNASLRITCFPTVSVADGRSTVTVTAEVRDNSGRAVPDGSQVVFTTTLGTFRNAVVTTTNGLAQAILVAGSIPGHAKITATALAFNTVSTYTFEFVGDRSMLSTAKEYIEVTAPDYLMYSMDQRVIGAAGPNKGVNLRYRDIEIESDDLQVNVTSYEVRARKAVLRMGKFEKEFDELYFVLNQRRGFGTTTYEGEVVDFVGGHPFMVPVATKRLRYGILEITGTKVHEPTSQYSTELFVFDDLIEATSGVAAKKATIFPRRNIQFQKADIYIGTTKIASVPLYQLPVYAQSPLVTDQIVNINDSEVSVNYPHYLTLKPGVTSLLRFRTGEKYGRTAGVSHGAFLDYELSWNKGDDMEGGLVVSGLARDDWSVGMRQYLRLDDRSSINAMLEFPAHRAMYGSASYSRHFNGFQMSMSGSHSRSLQGTKFENQSYSLVLEKDATKVGKLPFRMFYGVTATSFSTDSPSGNLNQSAVGMRLRMQMLPQILDSHTMLNASFAATKQQGRNTLSGLGYSADLSLSRRLGPNSSALLGYSFIDDGFTSSIVGKQNLSFQGYMEKGRTYISLFGSRGLDVDRLSIFADASYRVSGLWRMTYSHTFNRYIGDSYLDNIVGLNYRLGFREIGLTWSSRTNRLGFQVFGASIY